MSSTGLQKAYDYIKIKRSILRKRDPKSFNQPEQDKLLKRKVVFFFVNRLTLSVLKNLPCAHCAG